MMSGFNRWDVWLAEVKYEDSDEVKERPVLIYNETEVFIVGFKGTSSIRKGDDEYTLIDWKKAGLLHETNFRLSKKLRIEKSKFKRKIGTITKNDRIIIEFRLRYFEGK